MNEPILLAKAEREADGRIAVRSPLVGTWIEPPHAGTLLGPGSRIGLIAHLNRRLALVLPDGAAGRVVSGLPGDRAVAVEYAQVLFELTPVGAAGSEALEGDACALGHPADAGLSPGTRAVVSPTDGVFYRRASPTDPPFVEAGSRVRTGDAIGLVEVMKTFNLIAYGGPGFPPEAEVLEVRCADAQEVRAGQILAVVR
jgi:biotin carboxyl carrier protein